MTAFYVPSNQSVSFTIYWQSICNESGLSNDFLRAKMSRIHQAFEMGEPIWMITLELQVSYDLIKNYKPQKTPLQLAKRVVRQP